MAVDGKATDMKAAVSFQASLLHPVQALQQQPLPLQQSVVQQHRRNMPSELLCSQEHRGCSGKVQSSTTSHFPAQGWLIWRSCMGVLKTCRARMQQGLLGGRAGSLFIWVAP